MLFIVIRSSIRNCCRSPVSPILKRISSELKNNGEVSIHDNPGQWSNRENAMGLLILQDSHKSVA